MSMATWRMLLRQVRGVVASQARTSATVRPSTWPSSPPVPRASTNPVCHRSRASCHLPLSGSCSQRVLPRRVSSMPSTSPRAVALRRPRGQRAEGVHHRRPGQMQVAGGLDDRGAGIAYPVPGRIPQPPGQPGPGRDLRDLSVNDFQDRPARGTTSGACATRTPARAPRKGDHGAGWSPSPSPGTRRPRRPGRPGPRHPPWPGGPGAHRPRTARPGPRASSIQGRQPPHPARTVTFSQCTPEAHRSSPKARQSTSMGPPQDQQR